MKILVKTVLVAVSLLLSAGPGFAADAVKADVKTSASAAKEKATASAADAKASVKGKLVDINSASEAELKAVAGIGAVYAAKIIAGRPYANKAQLKSRKIVPPVLYEQVKDQLIAKQPKK